MHSKSLVPGRFLGEFECLSAIPEYSITIRALTPCTLYVIPANLYREWMKNDGNALFLRTQKILYDLTKQTRNDREVSDAGKYGTYDFIFDGKLRKGGGLFGTLHQKDKGRVVRRNWIFGKTINRNAKSWKNWDFFLFVQAKFIFQCSSMSP